MQERKSSGDDDEKEKYSWQRAVLVYMWMRILLFLICTNFVPYCYFCKSNKIRVLCKVNVVF